MSNSLLDLITGGADNTATQEEEQGLQAAENLNSPTTAQLTIPQLQQYVQAGIMTPAQAQAYLQNSNAYNNIKLDPTSMAAEYSTLAQEQNIANQGGMDAEEKQQAQAAQDLANSTLAGQEQANVLQAEQRGVAPQLAVEAANAGAMGNEANALFEGDEQAATAAEQRQLQALANAGTEASTIQGQTYNQSANEAAAQNAINQFNAQNQTQVSQGNAANTQAANLYNTENAQNVSNANTTQNNARTEYNATQAPETAYENALQKVGAIQGGANSAANQQMQEGQQSAGLFSSLLGSGAQLGGSALQAGATNNLAAAMAASDGAITAENGLVVPGKAKEAGDSPKNDFVKGRIGNNGPEIRVSPGEGIIPRSIMQHPDPVRISQFLRSLPRQQQSPKVHPQDIATVLRGLSHIRNGGV